jgi:hypothetical protein
LFHVLLTMLVGVVFWVCIIIVVVAGLARSADSHPDGTGEAQGESAPASDAAVAIGSLDNGERIMVSGQ